MIKHPHPSGRPIRIKSKPRYAMSVQSYIGPLTLRLRKNENANLPDAIGWKEMPEQEEGCPWCIGFVHFKDML